MILLIRVEVPDFHMITRVLSRPVHTEIETVCQILSTEILPMPSKSAKQKRTMAAAAHNPAFAKKMGIPVKVAKEFNKADKRKGKKK